MVYVKIFMQHIWPIYKKYIHTCERNAIEIDDREHFQNIFIDTLSFSLEKIHRNENGCLTVIYNRDCLQLFPIRKPLGIPHKIFQRYHPGPLQDKIPLDIIFLAMC